MSRVEENKLLKKKSLMDTAFQLFTSQGLGKTSIADIAQRAGVAKGTFYLYFKDKYDLHERLVVRKSEELFSHAMAHSGYETQTTRKIRSSPSSTIFCSSCATIPCCCALSIRTWAGAPSVRYSTAPAWIIARSSPASWTMRRRIERSWRSWPIPCSSWWAQAATA